MDREMMWAFLSTKGADFALKVAGALAVWIVGRWLIGLLQKVIKAGLQRSSRIDATLSGYLSAAIAVLLNIGLILAVLDIFGVRTTSFAALLAGAGLAIGTAWGGLLQHFAAGVFLQVLRPYKVGDHVIVAGVNGIVKELGLFGTTILTADSIVALVGNNRVLGDTIQNLSAAGVRRVDATAKIAHGVDVHDAIERITAAVARIPHVVAQPPPQVDVIELTPEGPLLCVRPYTDAAHHGQVLFDTHRAIVKAFGEAGYPVPETPSVQRSFTPPAVAASAAPAKSAA